MSQTSYPIGQFGWATAIPTGTDHYYQKGTFLVNPTPSNGGAFGWVCTVAGRPGTWRVVAAVNEVGVSAMTAAGVITSGAGYVSVSLAAGNTMTLAQAADHVAGFRQTIKNLANNSVTIATVAGATYADAAAITLAQYASVTIVGDGSTWNKAD